MICLYYRWRISIALDSEDPVGNLPHSHLRRCPACREFHERCLRIGTLLRQASKPLFTAGRAQAVQSVRIRLRLPAVGVGLAACLVAAVLLWGVWRASGGRGRVAQPTGPSDALVPRLALLSPAALLDQVRQPLESVTQSAAVPIRMQVAEAQGQLRSVARSMFSCLPIPGR